MLRHAKQSPPAGLHIARFNVMGGPAEIRAWAEPAVVESAIDEVRRLHAKYSRYTQDSITTQINRAAGRGWLEVDAETDALLDYAATLFTRSQGMFDITSGVLRRIWRFETGAPPAAAEITATLRHVGWTRVARQPGRIALPGGMELDFGGIVKEYAADRAVAVLQSCGVQHGLVDLAGDLATAGPLPDGRGWLIRIRHPRIPGEVLGCFELHHGGVATSGDYERYFEFEGKRYSHILNPLTGWPVEGLCSATVRHDSCLVAGSLTTIALLKGAAGRQWLAEQGVDAICFSE